MFFVYITQLLLSSAFDSWAAVITHLGWNQQRLSDVIWGCLDCEGQCPHWTCATYQFPGIADVVCIFAVVSEPVSVPGQRGVDGHGNDLTAQREAARNTHNQTTQNRHTTQHNTTTVPMAGRILVLNAFWTWQLFKCSSSSYFSMFCLTTGNPGMFS